MRRSECAVRERRAAALLNQCMMGVNQRWWGSEISVVPLVPSVASVITATAHWGLVNHTRPMEISSASELVTLFASLAQSEHFSIGDGIKLENEWVLNFQIINQANIIHTLRARTLSKVTFYLLMSSWRNVTQIWFLSEVENGRLGPSEWDAAWC